jgi:RNA polymerase sigma factor for flagellar operon FliA
MTDPTPGLEPALHAIEEYWRRFKEAGDPGARQGLILHYSPLVKFVAGRVGVGLPRSVEQSDLISYGMFGLIDAIDKFEPERNIKFETYAVNRIKGAQGSRLGAPVGASPGQGDPAVAGRTGAPVAAQRYR